MTDTRFWVRRGIKTVGPLTKSQIRRGAEEGRLLHTDEVAQSPAGPWRKLGAMLASLDSHQSNSKLTDARMPTVARSGDQDRPARPSQEAIGGSSRSVQSPEANKATESAARPSGIAWLAHKWHQLPVIIPAIFYLVVVAVVVSGSLAKSRGYAGYDDAMRLAVVIGCIVLSGRFLISEYCLPVPGGVFYLRNDEGAVSGPFNYDQADEIQALRDGRGLNRICRDGTGPWFFWLDAFVDDKNSTEPNVTSEVIAFIRPLYRHKAVRAMRYLFWSIYVLSAAFYFIWKLRGGDSSNIAYRLVAAVFEIGPIVAVCDLALVFMGSPLYRCWQRYIAKSNAADDEKRKREAAERTAEQEQRARREAHEAFQASELVTGRRITGLLMQVQGISCRNTHNDTATVAFESDGVELLLPGGVRRRLAANEIESVVIGGRGKFTSSQDDAWSGGGFGVTGAIKGALNAAALNYLTSLLTKQDHCECLLLIKWQKGEVIILNTFYEPEAAWGVIGPMVERYSMSQG